MRKKLKTKTIKREGYIEVIKIIDKEEEPSKKETILVKEFKTDTARVSASFGASSDYGKLKVNIYVSIPCYVEEVEEALEYVVGLAERKSKVEFNKLVGEFDE